MKWRNDRSPTPIRDYRKKPDSGPALPINNIFFAGNEYRHGANADTAGMLELLKQLGYYYMVHIFEDLSSQQMVAKSEWFSRLAALNDAGFFLWHKSEKLYCHGGNVSRSFAISASNRWQFGTNR
ncbi:hypothetical protein niasHT_023070 [Heterodera trifolii]|uniref:Caspase family p20 domain-containing protein n=1 Tax=Heterodera trifolii TaxID=157864 RepID=A0ABD2KF36_9BILA